MFDSVILMVPAPCYEFSNHGRNSDNGNNNSTGNSGTTPESLCQYHNIHYNNLNKVCIHCNPVVTFHFRAAFSFDIHIIPPICIKMFFYESSCNSCSVQLHSYIKYCYVVTYLIGIARITLNPCI